MTNKQEHSRQDAPPQPPSTDLEDRNEAHPPAVEEGGADDIQRRNQAIKDKSLGAPETGMPGTPKPARR